MSTISVIIPCYNAAPWIRQTLLSVINQTHPAHEIIVVDDGSTDECATIVAREFPQVTLIYSDNKGPGSARNIGSQVATGEWLEYLDSDDIINTRKHEWQLSQLIHASESVAFAYSPWQYLENLNDKWIPVGPLRSSPAPTDPYEFTLGSFTHLSSGLVRRVWWNRLRGFDTSFKYPEDVLFQFDIVRALGDHQFLPTAEPIFWYRQVPQSFSKRDPKYKIEKNLALTILAEKILCDSNELTEKRRKMLLDRYFHAARYFAEHDQGVFEEIVQAIERLTPKFMPDSPTQLKFATRILGYRRAEQLSVVYRRIKRKIQPSSQHDA